MDHALATGMPVSGSFFGRTIGSRYAGATPGMAFGTSLIETGTWATVLIAILVLIGATLDSYHVVSTPRYRHHPRPDLAPLGSMVMMLTAALVIRSKRFAGPETHEDWSPHRHIGLLSRVQRFDQLVDPLTMDPARSRPKRLQSGSDVRPIRVVTDLQS